MTRYEHGAYHSCLDINGKAVLPHIQLLKLLEINHTALNEEFAEELEKLIRTDKELIYKNHVFRRNTKQDSN